VKKKEAAIDFRQLRGTLLSAASSDAAKMAIQPKHRVAWKDVELKNQIGEGAYALVYEGSWLGHPVAVKEIKYDANGVSTLTNKWITTQMRLQRKGRTGRVMNGVVVYPLTKEEVNELIRDDTLSQLVDDYKFSDEMMEMIMFYTEKKLTDEEILLITLLEKGDIDRIRSEIKKYQLTDEEKSIIVRKPIGLKSSMFEHFLLNEFRKLHGKSGEKGKEKEEGEEGEGETDKQFRLNYEAPCRLITILVDMFNEGNRSYLFKGYSILKCYSEHSSSEVCTRRFDLVGDNIFVTYLNYIADFLNGINNASIKKHNENMENFHKIIPPYAKDWYKNFSLRNQFFESIVHHKYLTKGLSNMIMRPTQIEKKKHFNRGDLFRCFCNFWFASRDDDMTCVYNALKRTFLTRIDLGINGWFCTVNNQDISAVPFRNVQNIQTSRIMHHRDGYYVLGRREIRSFITLGLFRQEDGTDKINGTEEKSGVKCSINSIDERPGYSSNCSIPDPDEIW
jgi:hypothetical protein